MGGLPQIDDRSRLARWAAWQARVRGDAPLGALGVGDRLQMLFVESELLVAADDRETSAELVERWGATVVEDPPLPPVPPGMRGGDPQLVAGFPRSVRHRLPAVPPGVSHDALEQAASELGDSATITSPLAAATLALAVGYVREGRAAGVNAVGSGAALPYAVAHEAPGAVGGSNPYAWPCFGGRAQVTRAWQLVESLKLITDAHDRSIRIGVLDGGFWLDPADGRPIVPLGESESDFGTQVTHLRLPEETQQAGGPGRAQCKNGACPWHGNATAGVAAATVGNGAGAAGAGGTVAQPVLFDSKLCTNEVLRCLHLCLAWGVDVLNMSFAIAGWSHALAYGLWNNSFAYAASGGLIMVAGAGNDGAELPDLDVRPATRTPGVITVGWLARDDTAHPSSNYGSSVNVWAPGSGVPTPPDPNNPHGSLQSGTSMATPIVAGVAAMIRRVNPTLGSEQIRTLLHDTGWQGTGRVDRGLDALAAVAAAMGHRLPNEAQEPNDSPATARPLLPLGPDGTLGPAAQGIAALATGGDHDWWSFHTDGYADLALQAEWYAELSGLLIDLIPDDAGGRTGVDVRLTQAQGQIALAGTIAPGSYRVHVTGQGATAYRLVVGLSPSTLEPDQFERNDDFDHATRMSTEPVAGSLAHALRIYGPGRYEATLHMPADRDVFVVEAPTSLPFLIPEVTIADTDQPVDVTVFDAARHQVASHAGVRGVAIELPKGAATYVEVSGAAVTRYAIDVHERVARDALPGPFQEQKVLRLPAWWGDPVVRIPDRVTHVLVTLDQQLRQERRIVFDASSDPGLTASLLDGTGATIRTAAAEGDGHPVVSLDLGGLADAAYVVRLDRGATAADGVASVRLRPPFGVAPAHS
jgi:hypothetical protein